MNTHTPCSCRALGCQQSRPSARMASGPSPEPGEPCQTAIGSEACPSNWAGILLFWGASGGAGEQRTDFSFLKKKKKFTQDSVQGEKGRGASMGSWVFRSALRTAQSLGWWWGAQPGWALYLKHPSEVIVSSQRHPLLQPSPWLSQSRAPGRLVRRGAQSPSEWASRPESAWPRAVHRAAASPAERRRRAAVQVR